MLSSEHWKNLKTFVKNIIKSQNFFPISQNFLKTKPKKNI